MLPKIRQLWLIAASAVTKLTLQRAKSYGPWWYSGYCDRLGHIKFYHEFYIGYIH